MKTPRQRIEEVLMGMVGEDRELWKPKSFPEGKEGILDSETVPIALQNARDMRDNHYEIGYNQALADIRSRVPEAAGEIVEAMKSYLESKYNTIEDAVYDYEYGGRQKSGEVARDVLDDIVRGLDGNTKHND